MGIKIQWTPNNKDQPTSMVADTSGNVFITGYSRGIGTDDDYATIKYNSSVCWSGNKDITVR
ncbi:MAG: SBBP repeat-containing protein [Ignavibacteria bacterium]|nr:SBBP repeat-containing protein [Ignavibacteria bacterium]